jgi:hypothetical protein
MKSVKRYFGRSASGTPIEDPNGMFVIHHEITPLVEALDEVLRAFATPHVIAALESDAGPGHRRYRSEPLTDLRIRELRAELARWKRSFVPSKGGR